MTNQPSDAAKELSHRIVCEFRPDGWVAKEIEIAHLLDRHLTPAVNAELVEALQWALDELNGRTRYDEDVADQQIENCFQKAEAALSRAKEGGA